MFDYTASNLPVKEIVSDVQNKLHDNDALIVKAPPGAGKSTLLPLTLLNEKWLQGKKIIMLEPRRLAAKTIAMRMADLLGESVGSTVGYRIRFENKTSEKTVIEVVTEGILTRMIQTDNALENVGLVIFDEFHERSLHADVAMALCRETQQILRPDLKILVMSATLDMSLLGELLNAPTIESKGRQYPVEIKFTGETDPYLLPELTAKAVLKASRDEKEGDILVFFPGEGEIKKCEEILHRDLKEFIIHPLYGKLPPNKQQAAITPDKTGKRKVVLATSIAETSLTIEGVKIVVDTGFGRTQKFDPKSGLSRLETVQISRDAADQRAGRAGRLGPGVCYRMWTPATDHRLEEHRSPEILDADLAALMLDMAQWGITDPNQLTWLTPPPKGAISQAKDLLTEINALSEGKITKHGKAIHKLPCHPRIAHMLIWANDNNLLSLATDLAALLDERDPLPRNSGIDINLRIEALRRFRKTNSKNGNFHKIEKIASQYRSIFNIVSDNYPGDVFETGMLLAHAFPERIARLKQGSKAQFQLANGKLAMVDSNDDLAHESWISIASLDARSGMGKIFLASPLNPKDLSSFIKEKEIVAWNTNHGGLIATQENRIGSIVLKSTPLTNPDKNLLVDAITEAITKEGSRLLNFNKEVSDWQARILSLKKWNPNENWPDVNTEVLLETNSKWLKPYLENIKTPEDLKKINLKEILHYSLPIEKQETLNKLAPTKIEVPSGSTIKIQYQKNGSQPVLEVRLQECFGLDDTPKVNNGKTGVLMHLLSPGFKAVQVTSDLKSFWENAYFEVKKDLKRRYPKHSWPEDPWNAEAVRGVKRKK